MNRLERLINLVAALIDTPRPLTADALRERVPGYAEDDVAFRRAFERDKEALREMGVPITLEPVDPDLPEAGVGYRVRREEYELPDPGLDADELAALHLAASAVRVEGVGTPGVQALWKLGGAVAEGGPVAAVVALPGEAHLASLFGAVASHARVSFRYKGEDRAVDPWRLAFRNGHWYLSGWDHGREDERLFRVDRIESAVDVGDADSFEPPRDGAAASRDPSRPWELGGDPETTALLLVDEPHAGWAASQVGADAVRERRPDGSVVLAARVTNRGAFVSFVLGFLDHAEVLGPPELRAEVVDWLRRLCPA